MRTAPAVAIELTGCRRWRFACAALGGAAAAGLAAVGGGHAELDPLATVLLVLVALLAGAVCGRALDPVTRGRLRWDGAAWWLATATGDERTGALRPMIDLGGWMLLRFEPADSRGSVRWLPVPRQHLEVDEVGLRAAVYCRRLESPRPERRGSPIE